MALRGSFEVSPGVVISDAYIRLPAWSVHDKDSGQVVGYFHVIRRHADWTALAEAKAAAADFEAGTYAPGDLVTAAVAQTAAAQQAVDDATSVRDAKVQATSDAGAAWDACDAEEAPQEKAALEQAWEDAKAEERAAEQALVSAMSHLQVATLAEHMARDRRRQDAERDAQQALQAAVATRPFTTLQVTAALTDDPQAALYAALKASGVCNGMEDA